MNKLHRTLGGAALLAIFVFQGCNFGDDRYPEGTCDCGDLTDNGEITVDADLQPYTGHCIQFYEDSTLMMESNFKDGLLDGAFKMYRTNGNLERTVEWGNGVKNGRETFYYNNGNKELEGSLADGLKEKKWVSYHTSGGLKTIVNYSNGKRHDSCYAFFESGNMKSRGYFNQGQRQGRWISYDSLNNATNLFYENDSLIQDTLELVAK